MDEKLERSETKPTSMTDRARKLREDKTKSEGLLWSLLRSRQVSGLKFRQQHVIGGHITDFACVAKKLVVEIDGGYHELTYEKDQDRQREIEGRGWKVIRFDAADVEDDPESVARAIAAEVKVPFEFRARVGRGKRPVTKPR